jgi:hypothetical protein
VTKIHVGSLRVEAVFSITFCARAKRKNKKDSQCTLRYVWATLRESSEKNKGWTDMLGAVREPW